jgi:glycosyltransferase involved in cell wall biosynthesis
MNHIGTFPYDLTLRREAKVLEPGGLLQVIGFFTHSLDGNLDLSESTAEGVLRLGFRILGGGDTNTILFEDRAHFSSSEAPAETPCRFVCNIPGDVLTERFTLQLSLLREGAENSYWFFNRDLRQKFLFQVARDGDIGSTYVLDAEPGHGKVISVGPHENASRAQRPSIYLDITDLLFYLAHHRHVSGIQRVQCGYLSSITKLTGSSFRYCAQRPSGHVYFELEPAEVKQLLARLTQPKSMSVEQWTSYVSQLRDGQNSPEVPFRPGDVILTTGAPWVTPDYFLAINNAKRDHGVRYFQVYYDLIPTLLPETVEGSLIEGFNRVVAGMFEFADHIFSISDFSASEMQSLAATLNLQSPPISVIKMGGTIDYDEDRPKYLPRDMTRFPKKLREMIRSEKYVLCVGTLEPRKNHIYLYNLWKRLLKNYGADTPKLVCIGRFGWHTEELQRYLKVSNYLDGHFVHLKDISDSDLQDLYQYCQFTIFPSVYEGWGLPVGESLYFGRVCVASNSTSVPEVGGEWATYIDPYNLEDGYARVKELIEDPALLASKEQHLQAHYKPITWRSAALDFVSKVERVVDEILAADMRPSLSIAPNQDRSRDHRKGSHGVLKLELNRPYNFASNKDNSNSARQIISEIEAFRIRNLLAGPSWNSMESWGCWAAGRTARLTFSLPSDAPPKVCAYVSVWIPSHFGDRLCDITVNGNFAGRQMISPHRGRHLRIGVERSWGGDQGVFKLEMTLDRVVTAAEAGISDARLLGIGMKMLYVCDFQDVFTRLEYLEDHVLG